MGITDPDAALVPRLIQGDECAFRELWEKYAKRIQKYIGLQSRSVEDAEDITIDVFVRCARGVKRFRGQSTLCTWLYRLAHNATVDFYRRRQASHRMASLDVLSGTPVVSAGWRGSGTEPPDPYTKTCQQERNTNLHRVLSNMKSDHGRIIFLRNIEGFSIAETAAILGKTEAAVKMLLLRALSDLSDQLQKDTYFSARGAQ